MTLSLPNSEGSSPRMRGAQSTALPLLSASGIIPAYAGSTPFRLVGGAFLRDHPRVCGEHRKMQQAINAGKGSSPRMRGAPFPC